MCYKITCETCRKQTWAGCGNHIEQALRGVPKDERCKCREDGGKSSAAPSTNFNTQEETMSTDTPPSKRQRVVEEIDSTLSVPSSTSSSNSNPTNNDDMKDVEVISINEKKRTNEKNLISEAEKKKLKKKNIREEHIARQKANFNPRKKRKYAVLFGYLGTNYWGLQIQPDKPTVEGELEAALHKAGGISDHNHGGHSSLQKIGWSRAARTDKGVHAAASVVSLKLMISTPTSEEMVEKINSYLPEQIRVFKLYRTMNSFSCYSMCSGRNYEYVLPSWVLSNTPPAKIKSSDSETNLDGAENAQKSPKSENIADSDESKTRDSHEFDSDFEKCIRFRIGKEQIDRVNEVLNNFVGTFSFHNFTRKLRPDDPSCTRYIKSFCVNKIFVVNDMEFVSVIVDGQSFILNQIRKMVGFMVGIIRGNLKSDVYLPEVLKKGGKHLRVPLAPASGLFLEKLIYDGYAKKVLKNRDQLRSYTLNTEEVSTLDFEDAKPEIEKFKESHIYPALTKAELQSHDFTQFVHILNDGEWNTGGEKSD